MRRGHVVLASVSALVLMSFVGPMIVPAFSILRALASGDSPDLTGSVLTATLLGVPAICAAAVLGPFPIALAVFVWPEAQAEQGTKRAIDSVSLVVAGAVMAELFVPVCLLVRPLAAAAGMLLAYGLLAGVLIRAALRVTWRSVATWQRSSGGPTRVEAGPVPRVPVVAAGVLASLACGLLCAWATVALLIGPGGVSPGLSSGPGADVASLILMLCLAMLIGASAGAVLGLVPTAVLGLTWVFLQRRLGADRAVWVASVLVGAVVFVEMLVLLGDEVALPVVAYVTAPTGLAVVCLLVALRWALRKARARDGVALSVSRAPDAGC